MGLPAIVTPIDEEVREALAICKGNALDALRITLIANAFLEANRRAGGPGFRRLQAQKT